MVTRHEYRISSEELSDEMASHLLQLLLLSEVRRMRMRMGLRGVGLRRILLRELVLLLLGGRW